MADNSDDLLKKLQVNNVANKKYRCIICGFVYDEALGLPEEGITAGTAWDDIPDDWMCPECGVGKSDFEMAEI